MINEVEYIKTTNLYSQKDIRKQGKDNHKLRRDTYNMKGLVSEHIKNSYKFMRDNAKEKKGKRSEQAFPYIENMQS